MESALIAAIMNYGGGIAAVIGFFNLFGIQKLRERLIVIETTLEIRKELGNHE